jgi:hypothetical protein
LKKAKELADAKAKAAALALKNQPVVKVLPKVNTAVAPSANGKKQETNALELEKQKALDAIRRLNKKF